MYGADAHSVPRPLRGKNGEPYYLVGVSPMWAST
jgi:hypothetical protein